MQIWVVDDNEGQRNLIGRVAKEFGAQTRGFADGKSVFQALLERSASPDLLIIDIILPEMDGIELAMSLSRADAACPIIFMTGGDMGLAHAAMEIAWTKNLKVRDVLAKPVSVADLRGAMDAALA